MARAAETARRYRVLALAIVASAALHAAIVMRAPLSVGLALEEPPPPFEAVLVAAPPQAAPAPPAAAPAPRRARPRRAASIPPDALAALPVATANDAMPELAAQPEPELVAQPEIVALALPATPVRALEPPQFPVAAVPADIAIDYRLTSAFADGRATYHWKRDGDSYSIRGEAEAEGFFALFLEGRIEQESHGSVTAAGLRPDRFTERRPNAGSEGLTFDWEGRTVTFERNNESRTAPLADSTVDWLSMIFQLAHVPPSTTSYDLQVFTQRRMYRFQLQVLGVEEIDIPLGRVRALHLRHEDATKNEVVDVWLGIDHYNVPVKLRYPVARNRLVVEQLATRVQAR